MKTNDIQMMIKEPKDGGRVILARKQNFFEIPESRFFFSPNLGFFENFLNKSLIKNTDFGIFYCIFKLIGKLVNGLAYLYGIYF